MERSSFPRFTAPGPTGERHEHAQQVLQARHRIFVRRWNAALDEFICQAYIGTISPHVQLDPQYRPR
eukprot:10767084-Lingulodinium_polyedra.AAC.1